MRMYLNTMKILENLEYLNMNIQIIVLKYITRLGILRKLKTKQNNNFKVHLTDTKIISKHIK